MKNHEKLRIFGEIDEKYLDEANEEISFSPRKSVWVRGLSIAACAVLVCGIVSVPFLNGMMREDASWTKNESLGSATSDREMSWIWNEEEGTFDYIAYSSLADKVMEDESIKIYPEIQIKEDTDIYPSDTVYYVSPMLTEGDYRSYAYFYRKVNLKNIDYKMGETQITLGIGKNEEKIVCNAEVYAIRGIDPDYALAVKADAVNFYVQNSNARGYLLFYKKDVAFESFAELVGAYALKEQMYVGPAFVEGLMTGTGIVENIIYPSEENRLFCEKLLAIDGILCNTADIAEDSLSIGVECGFLVAGGPFGIQIFEDGYLVTNIGGTLHTFDIGKETAMELIAFAETIPEKYCGVNFYDGKTDGLNGEETLPYDPAQSSGGYIPETTTEWRENSYQTEETTGVYPDDTAVERYPIETISK
ncbi:MAG: hypothetical protein IJ489_11315 [Clostridia bacterium]|nr:hypothetical protein [Clostridia bacterium]